MLVFAKQKLVLLSVPKTGSTAYETALAPLASMVISAPPELKHAPVFRYNRFIRPMIARFLGEEVDVVAVMREPVSWLGSWFRYRQRAALAEDANSTRSMSFDDFVTAYCTGQPPGFAMVGSQAKFLEPQRNGTRVTHLFRYEDQAGLRSFCRTARDNHRNRGREHLTRNATHTIEARRRPAAPQVRGRFRAVGRDPRGWGLLATARQTQAADRAFALTGRPAGSVIPSGAEPYPSTP